MKYIGKRGQLRIGNRVVEPGEEVSIVSITTRYSKWFENPRPKRKKKKDDESCQD